MRTDICTDLGAFAVYGKSPRLGPPQPYAFAAEYEGEKPKGEKMSEEKSEREESVLDRIIREDETRWENDGFRQLAEATRRAEWYDSDWLLS